MDLLTLVLTKLALMGFVLGLRWVLLQVVEGLRDAARPRVAAPPAPPLLPTRLVSSHDPENSVAVGTGVLSEPTVLGPLVWPEVDDLSRSPDHRRIRLRTPDFEAVAHELGAPLPRCVRDLYKNAKEVLREDFLVHAPRWRDKTEEWPIRHYAPADYSAALYWTESNRNLRTFRFAEDPLGNHYVIRLDQEDPPVWVQQRGTGRMTFACPRFSDFMRAPREPRRIPAPPAPRHEGLPSPMAWMK